MCDTAGSRLHRCTIEPLLAVLLLVGIGAGAAAYHGMFYLTGSQFYEACQQRQAKEKNETLWNVRLTSAAITFDRKSLRYTRVPDGKELIALQYDECFKLGQVDGDDTQR